LQTSAKQDTENTKGAQNSQRKTRRSEMADREELNALSERVIGLAIQVHRELGPGLLESTYRTCLCYELNQAGIEFFEEVQVPIKYKNI